MCPFDNYKELLKTTNNVIKTAEMELAANRKLAIESGEELLYAVEFLDLCKENDPSAIEHLNKDFNGDITKVLSALAYEKQFLDIIRHLVALHKDVISLSKERRKLLKKAAKQTDLDIPLGKKLLELIDTNADKINDVQCKIEDTMEKAAAEGHIKLTIKS